MYYLLITYQATAKWPLTNTTDTPNDYGSVRLIWNKTSQEEEVYNLTSLRPGMYRSWHRCRTAMDMDK